MGEFGLFDGPRGSFIVLNRPYTDIEIQFLSNGDIERPDSSAYRRCLGAVDPYQVFFKSLQGILRQPVIISILLQCLLTGVYLKPLDFLLATIGFFNSIVYYMLHCRGDIRARAISLNKWNNRVVSDIQTAIIIFFNNRSFRRNF